MHKRDASWIKSWWEAEFDYSSYKFRRTAARHPHWKDEVQPEIRHGLFELDFQPQPQDQDRQGQDQDQTQDQDHDHDLTELRQDRDDQGGMGTEDMQVD